MKHAAIRRLHGHGDVTIEERVYGGDEAVGAGGALVLWAETDETLLGASALAEKGTSSERVGEAAARDLAADLDARTTLDVHGADQLLLYMALAEGPSTFHVRSVTRHLRTMAWLLPQFIPRPITIEGQAGLWRVRVGPTSS